ncbi:MAG: YMGG-like glycine zipper-containing protein [Desulfatirhabdiaceae bacterium]
MPKTTCLAICLVLSMTGCTHMQKAAGVGAAVGATIGQVAWHTTNATLIGAGVGALIGIVSEADKSDPGKTRCHKITTRTYNPDGSIRSEKITERCDGKITYRGY